MSSIVLELQRDAIDTKVPVSDLLRKALVVARKLHVTDIEKWTRHELDGYPPKEDVPSYRELHGRIECFNPYRGWIPIVVENSDESEILSRRHCAQSVSEIEHLVEGDGALRMHFAPEVEQAFMRQMRVSLQPVLQISKASLVGILNHVRNALLNWALQLEEQGILGEGLSFTAGEVTAAAETAFKITNFYGPVGSANIQQDVVAGTQNSVIEQVDTQRVIEFLAVLRTEMSGLSLSESHQAELRAETATLESQIQSPNPKPAILKESLLSIRKIIENVAVGGGTALLTKLAEAFVKAHPF